MIVPYRTFSLLSPLFRWLGKLIAESALQDNIHRILSTFQRRAPALLKIDASALEPVHVDSL